MKNRNCFTTRALALCLVALLALFTVACNKPATLGVKKMPAKSAAVTPHRRPNS